MKRKLKEHKPNEVKRQSLKVYRQILLYRRLRWPECYDECQHLVEEVYVSQEGETYRKQHYYQEDTYHNLIERLIISDSPVELSRYEIEYYRE